MYLIFGKIVNKNKDVYAIGGIIGLVAGTGEYHANINNAYNIGIINEEIVNSNLQTGGIAGTNWADLMIFNNCNYLKGTYSIGVGGVGSSTGVTELDDISKFPSVLEVVNAENAFAEDVNNVNGGYPILKIKN